MYFIIGSIASAVLGVIFIVIGIIKNHDVYSTVMNQLNGGSGRSGSVFIILGVIAIVISLGIAAYLAIKKKLKQKREHIYK